MKGAAGVAQRASVQPISRNRIPPHNLDAEQSVLGAMLESKEAIANVIEILQADDFYRPAHAEVYDTILYLYGKGEAVDAVTVADELGRRGTLDSIGGRPYILGLLEAYPTAAAAAYYARIVEEHALLRRLIEAGNEVQELGFSTPGDVIGAVDQAEEIIYQVGQRRLKDDLQPLRPLLSLSMLEIEKLYEQGADVTGVPTGFPDLDEISSGFQPSNLIIIAARPSMGKSSLMNDFALNAARQNVPVVIFSLEMSRMEIVSRFLSSEARVDSQRLRRGTLQEQDWTRLSAALGRLAEAPIFIDDAANVTLMEMRAKCRRLKAKHGLGMIIIDYLQLMSGPNKSENRQQEVSEISRNLKILARELQVPVICASQLNRQLEYRADKRPMLGDLRESGCLTGDTRIVRADTGESVALGDLYRRGDKVFPVWTLDDNLKIVKSTMTHVFPTGVKPIYRLKLRSGREVRATANHPFFTFDGWRRLDQLEPGARVAAARRVDQPDSLTDWPDDKVILLAHLLGDGSILKGQPVRYASQSEENLRAVRDAAKCFGIAAHYHYEEAARSYQLFLPAPFKCTHGKRNPINVWFDAMGLFDKRSYEKFVPREVFSLPDAQVALFLRHLWATDGFIGTKRGRSVGHPCIYYASSSRRLAEDVAALLTRFGIVARIATSPKDGYRDMYNVHVGSGDHVERFVSKIGAFGPKVAGLMQVKEYLTTHGRKVHLDSIPPDVWQRVLVNAGGRSVKRMEEEAGVKFASQFSQYTSTSREVVAKLGEYFDDSELKDLASSHVYWDEVKSIQYCGREEVFDATVLGTHNFIANGVIVSNSIEQDSDLVMFIYRDEVYNPDTEKKGEAELIVAKHRNGPTGTVNLAFLNQYTKFAPLAKGPGF